MIYPGSFLPLGIKKKTFAKCSALKEEINTCPMALYKEEGHNAICFLDTENSSGLISVDQTQY